MLLTTTGIAEYLDSPFCIFCQATLVRENNLKEYKLSNDLDQMPKFGAGSEYGRDMREEARRKKYGIMVKKYNPEDQPWQLKSGKGKEAKK